MSATWTLPAAPAAARPLFPRPQGAAAPLLRPPSGAPYAPRRPEERREEREEQHEPRQTKVDGVLEVDVVHFPPRRAALAVERQDVLIETDACDRVSRGDFHGHERVVPAP